MNANGHRNYHERQRCELNKLQKLTGQRGRSIFCSVCLSILKISLKSEEVIYTSIQLQLKNLAPTDVLRNIYDAQCIVGVCKLVQHGGCGVIRNFIL